MRRTKAQYAFKLILDKKHLVSDYGIVMENALAGMKNVRKKLVIMTGISTVMKQNACLNQ